MRTVWIGEQPIGNLKTVAPLPDDHPFKAGGASPSLPPINQMM